MSSPELSPSSLLRRLEPLREQYRRLFDLHTSASRDMLALQREEARLADEVKELASRIHATQLRYAQCNAESKEFEDVLQNLTISQQRALEEEEEDEDEEEGMMLHQFHLQCVEAAMNNMQDRIVSQTGNEVQAGQLHIIAMANRACERLNGTYRRASQIKAIELYDRNALGKLRAQLEQTRAQVQELESVLHAIRLRSQKDEAALKALGKLGRMVETSDARPAVVQHQQHPQHQHQQRLSPEAQRRALATPNTPPAGDAAASASAAAAAAAAASSDSAPFQSSSRAVSSRRGSPPRGAAAAAAAAPQTGPDPGAAHTSQWETLQSVMQELNRLAVDEADVIKRLDSI